MKFNKIGNENPPTRVTMILNSSKCRENPGHVPEMTHPVRSKGFGVISQNWSFHFVTVVIYFIHDKIL